MNIAKIVINLIIAFFIISGIYFKISDKASKGEAAEPAFNNQLFLGIPFSFLLSCLLF